MMGRIPFAVTTEHAEAIAVDDRHVGNIAVDAQVDRLEVDHVVVTRVDLVNNGGQIKRSQDTECVVFTNTVISPATLREQGLKRSRTRKVDFRHHEATHHSGCVNNECVRPSNLGKAPSIAPDWIEAGAPLEHCPELVCMSLRESSVVIEFNDSTLDPVGSMYAARRTSGMELVGQAQGTGRSLIL